jgi:U3 small nucleolar RNA-associated protein 12
VTSLDIGGHPTGIRAVALSSDDSFACTVSKNVTKVWRVDTRSCIQTVSPASTNTKHVSYGLCAAFLPGNAHVIVGTREGHLLVIDIAVGGVVYSDEKAHDGAIWSIDVRKPTTVDGAFSIVTGSADKSVKFWDIESSADDEDDASQGDHPIAVLTRTLEMADDVVAVRYSHSLEPSKRIVFVSTLDSTIKVFFDDSLKLFLSLYGHKLPALAVDSSDDDLILASGGADKTVKIWGLDFGDTHRTMHGHEDSITDLKFVRRTHNFFTSSKDGSLRYWDGDRFEQILLLNGHLAEVTCLAISNTGGFVLSGSMDRQVRVWERTKDIVFLEEERERGLEQTFDKVYTRDSRGTANILDNKGHDSDEDGDKVDYDSQPQSEAAVRKTILSVAAGDRLVEGLERADQEIKDAAVWRMSSSTDGKIRQSNPLLLGLEPAHYVLWILKSIKSAELEQSLLVLPFGHLERLVYYCTVLLRQGRGIELCSRVTIFVVKVHQNQIVADRSMTVPLRELRRLLRIRLAEARDMVGYNLAAMKLIQKAAQNRKQGFFDEKSQSNDIWAGLGLGSDVAAALEGKKKAR